MCLVASLTQGFNVMSLQDYPASIVWLKYRANSSRSYGPKLSSLFEDSMVNRYSVCTISLLCAVHKKLWDQMLAGVINLLLKEINVWVLSDKKALETRNRSTLQYEGRTEHDGCSSRFTTTCLNVCKWQWVFASVTLFNCRLMLGLL